MREPTLLFGPTSDPQGFVAAELAIADDGYPPAIIRELVQNSLDAAIYESDQEVAEVDFYIDFIKKNDIPGIKEYEQALKNIEVGYKSIDENFTDQEKGIISNIKRTLKQSHIPALFVVDNGIGLGEARMNKILGNGFSGKDNTTSGSRGNGHFASFMLSNLRYLLYGGVSDHGKDRKTTFSGQAILASQILEGLSHSGKYITGKGKTVKDHKFCKYKDIPDFIKDKMSLIKKGSSGTGSIICILGFHNFHNKTGDQVTDIILSAVAKNYFVAINQGILKVSVHLKGKEHLKLHKDNLSHYVYLNDGYNKRKEDFPNWRLASEMYEVLVSSDKVKDVNTSKKDKKSICRVYIKTQEVKGTKIALSRNGMWITNKIPGIEKDEFKEYKNFWMLITCDKVAGQFHELVRQSENNTHTQISPPRIPDNQRKQELEGCLEYIQGQIKEIIEPLPKGGVHISGGFTIDVVDSVDLTRVIGGSGKRETAERSRGPKDNGNKTTKGKRIDIGKNGFIRNSVVKAGHNKLKVVFLTNTDYKNLGISLEIPNGQDPTCDKTPNTSLAILRASRVTESDKVELSKYGELDNTFMIGDVNEDERVVLEVEYENDDQINILKKSVECSLVQIMKSNTT